MFRGGSHGLLGEEKKPKLSPPVSRELGYEGTGDESWAATSDVGSGRGKAAGVRPSFERETERGATLRWKERDAGARYGEDSQAPIFWAYKRFVNGFRFPATLREVDAGTGRRRERKIGMRAARVLSVKDKGAFEGSEVEREGEDAGRQRVKNAI